MARFVPPLDPATLSNYGEPGELGTEQLQPSRRA
jgi:hypothetical protein